MALQENMFRFLRFKQGTSPNLGKAPHKPILMLAVLETFEKGIISENRIYITPELLSYFRNYWNALVTSGHTPNFALPFFHLSNEKSRVWYLRSAAGFEHALTSSNSIKSLKALQDYVYYAYLDETFFIALANPANRLEAKQFILATYFNRTTVELQYDILNDAEQDILNDDPELYRVKMKKVLARPVEEMEEDRFIRGHAFKKAIPRIYENTCAITGLRVDATINVSMIDACHIVPFSESYNDTVTNGIALCPNMHRAFDRGLISIDENYKVLISNHFMESESNYSLAQFEGKEIALPFYAKYYPSHDSLAHHRNRFGFYK
jgi:putative restriction endonuclease